ncbi:MAG: endonuclease III [candidate division WOR-3 bacterium]
MTEARRAVAIARILDREWASSAAPIKLLPRRDPFTVLVGAVLSTRTQDAVTAAAVRRLMASAPSSARLSRMGLTRLRRLIYPVGFYRTKARQLHLLARQVAHLRYVPNTLEGLLELPGVGRKVANVVLAEAFGKPAVAVDTHVHRISNRLGLVQTTRSEQTEAVLIRLIPKRLRGRWNRLIVSLGQTYCRPVRPRCRECPVGSLCLKVGVDLREYQSCQSSARTTR